jgi:hypothetical protein
MLLYDAQDRLAMHETCAAARVRPLLSAQNSAAETPCSALSDFPVLNEAKG